jgi:fructoselysine and glucoselysine-specific PTS system IIA component
MRFKKIYINGADRKRKYIKGEKMPERKIVVATHGKLAEGFLTAMKIIVGESDDISAVNCYTTPDFDLEQTIDNVLEEAKGKELFVFTDLLGGSVNNGFLRRLGTTQFHLISNTSLGLLMDCSLMNPNADELRKKLGSGEFSAVYCNDLFESMRLEEDDL